MTPPLPALLNVPLARFRWESVRYYVSGAVFLAVLGSYLTIHFLFSRGGADRQWPAFFFSGFLIISFSYPFYFLFDRGNIDGFVLLLITLALLASANKYELAGGVLLGMAIACKVYPLLLFVPVALNRRWRMLAGAILTIAVLMTLGWELWSEFLFERLPARAGGLQIDENGSLVSTFAYFARLAKHALPWLVDVEGVSSLFRVLSYVVFSGLLGASALADWHQGAARSTEDFSVRVLTYFPFMVAMPALAYHYELVVLIALVPMLCWLWPRAQERSERQLLVSLAIGISLSQSQAVGWERILGTVHPHFFPGFGLFLVMIGSTILKWQRLGRPPFGTEHRPAASAAGATTTVMP